MDTILMLILSAFLAWAVEKSADAVFNLIVELSRSDRNSNHSKQQNEKGDDKPQLSSDD
ncbi:hypothetical protein I8752_28055 [Nostocaceae cyanobacterium CENA369]|uniref:Uncharacterized protein n=1 Tax=Dendronalium phyllosphericum CENA369 TaxID=1725256 RepID=A0A8J7IGR3_9NOST|nr:hypothetical protein [Dendronalium phyllosphericum]MBH8576777.1 hypothetical protein [Dendronalium phyllosphericum CENA369]